MSTRTAHPGTTDHGRGSDDDDLIFASHDLARSADGGDDSAPDEHVFVTPTEAAAQPAEVTDDTFVTRSEPLADPVDVGEDSFVIPTTTAEPAPTAAAAEDFHVSRDGAAGSPGRDHAMPWTVRGELPPPPAPAGPWKTRHNDVLARTAAGTVRRLRQEAVNISWTAAWLAITSSDAKLLRKRDL